LSRETKRGLRADIQGLRAVAVLTVLLSHAGVPFLRGGFVGVDVFFVISGFLITGLLLAEADRGSRISIPGFYARRARRILPAATLVLMVTVIASLIWTNVLQAGEIVKDGVWATFFAANIRFASIGADYFAQDEGPSPLQHYWSLAVEEQFYVVWPLVMVLLIVWHHRRQVASGGTPALDRRSFLGVLAAIIGLSLLWSWYRTGDQPAAAYFSSPARAWELAIGAACAVGGAAWTSRWTSGARTVAAAVGATAIAWSCLAYTPMTPFPGLAALVPVLGAALLLLAGQDTEARPTFVARGLSVPPMRLIGDWSYSLYLWHWPLLVIPEAHLGHPLSVTQRILAVAAALMLSGLSFRFVETPFRTSGRRRHTGRSLVLYPLSVALVLATCGSGWAWTQYRTGEFGDNPPITRSEFGVTDESSYDLAEDDTVALVQASVIAAQHHMAVPSDLTPDLTTLRADIADPGACNYELDARELCRRGDVDGDKVVVVIGDSHGRAWIPAFEAMTKAAGWSAYYLVKPHCTAALVVPGDRVTSEPWQECIDFHEWVAEQLAELHPDLAVVATSLPGVYVQRLDDWANVLAEADAGFRLLFEELKPLADRVTLLGDVPRMPVLPGDCLAKRPHDLGECLFTPEKSARDVQEVSRRAAEAVGGIQYVDPTKWLCYQGLCPAVVGSTIAYRDVSHITTEYSAKLGEPLGRRLGVVPTG